MSELLGSRFDPFEAAVESLYSPEGPVMVVPNLPGVPKFGVPLELKLTFCAMV